MNEATARLKINKLLESAGWRFFDEGDKPANIRLEAGVEINTLGDNFEKTSKGFIDFLLLDDRGFPLIVLEAKAEEKQPLVGKEQARKYARSQNCRFIILSNGNLHYFWDLDRGNPYIITAFPTPDSVAGYQKTAPNPQRLVDERLSDDYIVLTQRPNYASEAAWKNDTERPRFINANKLRFLRSYQLQAVHALQRAVKEGKDRFLFEMATGTGKTLTAAAIIKLFLRSSNAQPRAFPGGSPRTGGPSQKGLHTIALSRLSRRSFTKRTAMTGDVARSWSAQSNPSYSTTSTRKSSRPRISIS